MKDMILDIKQTNDTTNLFGGKKVFSYPKPIKFMEYLINNINAKDFIVLDFFSGSATTAQAVMNLNAMDKGSRKYICVQLPENLDENFKTTSEKDIVKNAISICNEIGSKHFITELAKERIRRAGAIYENQLDKIDTGFKVFKLDSSNLKKWNNTPTKDVDEVAKRIQLSMDYLEDGRTDLDLVYEIMLKYGLDLTLPISKSANGKAYIVEGEEYRLLICAERNLKLEDIEEFANKSVGTYLFADRCFSDDNLLINTQEILKAKNKEMRLF